MRQKQKTSAPSTRHPGGFIVAPRTDDALELLRVHPGAFCLAYLIARRARWKSGFNAQNLTVGEALIGDFEAGGLSERGYRTAKQVLQKHGFATFRSTSRGTIARLLDSRLFDINAPAYDGQNDEQATDKRRASDGQATTNQERKNGKTERKKDNEGPPDPGRPAASLRSAPPAVDYDEFERFVSAKQLDPNYADKWFDEKCAAGWLIRGQPIRDWKKVLVAFCEKVENDAFGDLAEP